MMKRNYQLILALAIFVTGCTMRFIATAPEVSP